jgi:nucleotide-binding universal stress UspA family protein
MSTAGRPGAAGTVRFVVGYGGDGRSRDALRLGVAAARAFGAELEIVLVVRADDPFRSAYPPVGDIGPVVREQARHWLREAQGMVPGDVVARTHLREAGSVAAGLLDAAAELAARLVVVGAGTGAGRLGLHPAVDALLHSSPVPVALAPRRYAGEVPLTHVYAAVGTRPGAHQVIEESVRAAERPGLELVLLSFLAGEDGSDGGAARRAVEDHLERAAAEVRRSSPVRLCVAGGSTLKKAVRAVDWAPGGVLLVGSSRLAQGHQIFLGATAARVLAHLPVPMVVVPRPAQETVPDPGVRDQTEKEAAS